MKAGRLALPVAALIGAGLAILLVVRGGQSPIAPAPGERPGRPAVAGLPFDAYVAGTGIVEAGTGNVAVGTPVDGVVAEVFVRWGEPVAAGAPLFRLDDRELRANLPLAEARAGEEKARLARARYQLGLAARLREQHVLSDEQYQDRKFDVQIGEAAAAAAAAEIERIRVEMDRRTVRASVSGRVLQINVRPGEFAAGAANAMPLMVIGDDAHLRVRVDIDEYDALRVQPAAEAIAVVRGNPEVRASLHFENIEPYVVPRKSLTGDTVERVDTRVLQAIYSFDRASLPVYVGQHLDVYIQARAAAG